MIFSQESTSTSANCTTNLKCVLAAPMRPLTSAIFREALSLFFFCS